MFSMIVQATAAIKIPNQNANSTNSQRQQPYRQILQQQKQQQFGNNRNVSCQASQPIRSSKDMLLSINTIKCFLGKIGDRYSFKKKLDNQVEKTIST